MGRRALPALRDRSQQAADGGFGAEDECLTAGRGRTGLEQRPGRGENLAKSRPRAAAVKKSASAPRLEPLEAEVGRSKRRVRQRAGGKRAESGRQRKKAEAAAALVQQAEAERLADAAFQAELLSKRADVIEQQSAALAQNNLQWELSVAFDPTDPVAMLKARQHLRANPYRSKASMFKPSVHAYAEERIVPVSYSAEATMRQEECAKEHGKAVVAREEAREALLEERRHEPQLGRKPNGLVERNIKLERETGQRLLSHVAAQLPTLKQALRRFDPAGTGRVSAEQFRSVVSELRGLLGLSAGEADRIVAELLEGNGLVNYALLGGIRVGGAPVGGATADGSSLGMFAKASPRSSSLTLAPLGHSVSSLAGVGGGGHTAAERLEQHLTEMPVPRRHEFAGNKYKKTNDLLRPGTGMEGFFPDSQRLLTTMVSPVEESLSPVRIERSARRMESKRHNLDVHIKRIEGFCGEANGKFAQLAAARVESKVRQQQRYFAPLDIIKAQDIRLAGRPTGKRGFPAKTTFQSQISPMLSTAQHSTTLPQVDTN